MYKSELSSQNFPAFGLPFQGHLDPSNRWVKKASLIPWAFVETEYTKSLKSSTRGAPAVSARMAFAALVIKEELRLSDRETVEQIRENPYLQFFVGMDCFTTETPFDASMMVYFRLRFPAESIHRINEAMVLSSRPMEEPPKPDDSPPKDNTPPSPPEASDTNDAPPSGTGKPREVAGGRHLHSSRHSLSNGLEFAQ